MVLRRSARSRGGLKPSSSRASADQRAMRAARSSEAALLPRASERGAGRRARRRRRRRVRVWVRAQKGRARGNTRVMRAAHGVCTT